MKTVHALTKWSINDWRYAGLCAAASTLSVIIVLFTFFFALKPEELNSFSLLRVCRYVRSSAVPKSRYTVQKKTNIVGASTQPSLTPLSLLKLSDMFTSYCTVPHILFMKRLNKTFMFWWASYRFLKNFEQTVSIYQIKWFCEINEWNIQCHIFLKLTEISYQL